MRRTSNSEAARSSAPERSLTQRLDALQRANEVRTKRAQLRKDLKGGRASIRSLLVDPPSYLETAKVMDMLLAVPKFGRAKVGKMLQQCRIAPSKTIGGLSERQRAELVSLLRGVEDPTEAWSPTAWTASGDGGASTSPDRIPAAEEGWQDGIGSLLSAAVVAQLLDVPASDLAEGELEAQLIVLPQRDGRVSYPAFQFRDDAPTPVLAEVHRSLVTMGGVSPWSAASWARTPHPELEGRSPEQWAARRRDDERLLLVARRDAARFAQ